MSSKPLATGLLVFCLLALLLGVYNALNIPRSSPKASKDKNGSASVSTLLGGAPHLAIITLSGPITMDSKKEGGIFPGESDAMSARKALDAAAKDDSVKGVLLRINSPGGTVAMSQELNKAVTRVSEKKPVVASLGDLAASGGYYTACAADHIVANPGTLTASIGVIISSFDLSRLMNQKLGVEAVTIKTGKFKDILSPYRAPTADDKALLQAMVMDSYHEFLTAVLTGRTKDIHDARIKKALEDKIRAVADGRVVTGIQAKAVGLVDSIGDQDFAYTTLDLLAKKRFKLKPGKSGERLPLRKSDDSFGLVEMLGLSDANIFPFSQAAAPNPLVAAASMLPLSARYPNQPLWVLE